MNHECKIGPYECLYDENIFNLPDKERPDCHKQGNSYAAVYGRILGEEPMTTLTTGFQSSGRGRYVHPRERRTLTLREAARLQSFPDWYWADAEKLGLRRANLQKIIGDAVPPFMIYPLAFSLFGKLLETQPELAV